MALTLPARAFPPLPPFRILDPEGQPVGPVPAIDDVLLERMARTMILVRRLDARMLNLQRQGRVGFYGTCQGQEAAPVGIAAALRDTDWVFPALREGAVMLFRGHPLERYLAQVFGRLGDPSKGRQMPSHQADRAVAFVSWSSCIGTQLPQAVGAARAIRGAGGDDVVVGFLGDGATSTGDFHVAMHAAGAERVPVVLVCQNNHWSISVPARAQTRSSSIAGKAAAYGLAHARVDGNDALAVLAAAREAVDRARTGGGPAFLELVTYRIGAHSSADDPRVYRDEAEVEAWRAQDPLVRFERFLRADRGWTDARLGALRDAVDRTIEAAIEAAERAPGPPLASLLEDVSSR